MDTLKSNIIPVNYPTECKKKKKTNKIYKIQSYYSRLLPAILQSSPPFQTKIKSMYYLSF